MNTFARMMMAGVLLLGLATATEADEKVEREQGLLKGRAVDTNGRPLPGVKVSACDYLHGTGCTDATTEANGRYVLEIQGAGLRATAHYKKPYNGITFCVALAASSADAVGARLGAVRDFTWKMTGAKERPFNDDPRNYLNYYGGAVQVLNYGRIPLDAQPDRFQLTLVPVGPLLDGSTGSAITVNLGDWHQLNGSTIVGNVPIGRYEVALDYMTPQGARARMPIHGKRPLARGGDAPRSTLIIDFSPDLYNCDAHAKAAIYIY